ncbi:MAG: lipid-binding protein, partial [Bacteroides sp.]
MDGMKNVALSTYNTANNTADEMFVDDKGNFWDFKVKVKANPGKLSFGSENKCPNYSYENCDVTVTDGKVLFGVGKSKTGLQTDSICFYVKFSDDKDNLTYEVAGHKRTGWTFDEY